MKKIYVGNLPFRATEEEIKQLFGEYGAVNNVAIVMDRETGRSRGFCFVEMANDADADAAIEALNGYEMAQRKLTVNEAREREQRGPGGGGGRGGFNRDRGDRGGNGGGRSYEE
ncbi:MAG: hypothetical protein HJJLKODD_00193 [Phycisphaerae bacterium]|nr:hypothetical protein [Phycisphaerae bacterium]